MPSSLHSRSVNTSLLRTNFQNNKTHLSLSHQLLQSLTQNNQIFSAFLQNLTKKLLVPKDLKKLTLDLKGTRLTPKNLQEVSQYLLQKLRNIKDFKIILSSNPFLQDQYFEFLLKTLRTFRSLKSFEVSLPKQLDEISQKHRISDLMKTLKKSAPRLQKVKFRFINEMDWGFYGKGFPILEKWGISRLGNLKSLSFYLPTSVFLNKRKLDLSALKGLARLESLNIELIDLPDDPRRGISKVLAFDPRKVFPNLKSFQWSILRNSLSKINGIEIVGSEIAARLGGLEDFGMRFHQDGELLHQDIGGITHCLASLQTNLNRFSLRMNFGDLNSDGSKALIEALAGPRLKRIRMLSLEFVQCKGVSKKFLAKLGKILGQNMKELRFLRLSFEKYQSLSSSFTKKLKAFLGFEGVSNQGICKLGSFLLEGCGNLEVVSLEFLRYPQISDRGAMGLCDSLRKISSLKKARLRFKFCPKVTDASIKYAKDKFGSQRDVKFTLI